MRVLPYLLLGLISLAQDGARSVARSPSGDAVLEALRGEDESAKMAALEKLEESVKYCSELHGVVTDAMLGKEIPAEKRIVRLTGLGVTVDEVAPLLVKGMCAQSAGLRGKSGYLLSQLRYPFILPALPDLLGLLESPRGEVSLAAIELLITLSPFPDDLVGPALLARWEDSRPDVRKAARRALSDVIRRSSNGGDPVHDVVGLIEPLRRLLADGDPENRRAAIGCLATIGIPARVARKELVPFLRDPDPQAQFNAACAVLRIERRRKTQEAEEARTVFLELVETFHPGFFGGHSQLAELPRYEEAIRALGSLGVGPVLAALEAEEKRSLRDRQARPGGAPGAPIYLDPRKIQTLGQLGVDGRGAIPALKRYLDLPQSRIQDTVAIAITSIDPSDADVIRLMTDIVEKRDTKRRDLAAWVLAECGPSAKSAIPLLEKEMTDPINQGSAWQDTVANTLARVDVGNDRALPIIIANLRAARSRYSWYAIETLGRQGPIARGAIPLLVDRAKGSQGSDRARSLEALVKIDPDRSAWLRELVRELDSPRAQDLHYAMVSLGRLGRRAEVAVPRLEGLTRARSSLIREAAETTLEHIREAPEKTNDFPKEP